MKAHEFLTKNLLYVSLVSLVFIASSALALSKLTVGQSLVVSKESKTFAPVPVLKVEATFPIISAQSALVVDLDSGVTLYDKASDKSLLPASTTKIITALVALDYYQDDLILKVEDETKVEGQKMGLVKGELIRVSELMYGLLVFSANDAAEILASNFPGGRDSFIVAMNLKAKELNLGNTNFVNPSGLDGALQTSTARDLVRVSAVAMENPKFAKIVGTKDYIAKSVDSKIKHKLVNINELVGKVEGVLGVKTGWTENARENLVTYIERDNKRIILALLGGQDRFGETKELIEWIFENYTWREVKSPQLTL